MVVMMVAGIHKQSASWTDKYRCLFCTPGLMLAIEKIGLMVLFIRFRKKMLKPGTGNEQGNGRFGVKWTNTLK